MEKEIIKQKIRELIWDYVLDDFESTCKSLVHKKEIKHLPTEKIHKSIYTYIFIIERYLSNKIIPIKYKVFRKLFRERPKQHSQKKYKQY